MTALQHAKEAKEPKIAGLIRKEKLHLL